MLKYSCSVNPSIKLAVSDLLLSILPLLLKSIAVSVTPFNEYEISISCSQAKSASYNLSTSAFSSPLSPCVIPVKTSVALRVNITLSLSISVLFNTAVFSSYLY